MYSSKIKTVPATILPCIASRISNVLVYRSQSIFAYARHFSFLVSPKNGEIVSLNKPKDLKRKGRPNWQKRSIVRVRALGSNFNSPNSRIHMGSTQTLTFVKIDFTFDVRDYPASRIGTCWLISPGLRKSCERIKSMNRHTKGKNFLRHS